MPTFALPLQQQKLNSSSRMRTCQQLIILSLQLSFIQEIEQKIIYKYIHNMKTYIPELEQTGFYTGNVTRGKESNATPATSCQPLSAHSWDLTHDTKIVGMFGSPLSPSPHNLSTLLKPEQVLELNFTRAA